MQLQPLLYSPHALNEDSEDHKPVRAVIMTLKYRPCCFTNFHPSGLHHGGKSEEGKSTVSLQWHTEYRLTVKVIFQAAFLRYIILNGISLAFGALAGQKTI